MDDAGNLTYVPRLVSLSPLLMVCLVIEFVLVGAMGLLPTWINRKGFGQTLSFNIVALTNA